MYYDRIPIGLLNPAKLLGLKPGDSQYPRKRINVQLPLIDAGVSMGPVQLLAVLATISLFVVHG